mmetsp:Transcript_108916/g.308026  ORF Transcript_108916/g.308026 Transcript_108916/m.308026 type:complete len:285 (-) Transcript_108916:257-1111(-)
MSPARAADACAGAAAAPSALKFASSEILSAFMVWSMLCSSASAQKQPLSESSSTRFEKAARLTPRAGSAATSAQRFEYSSAQAASSPSKPVWLAKVLSSALASRPSPSRSHMRKTAAISSFRVMGAGAAAALVPLSGFGISFTAIVRSSSSVQKHPSSERSFTSRMNNACSTPSGGRSSPAPAAACRTFAYSSAHSSSLPVKPIRLAKFRISAWFRRPSPSLSSSEKTAGASSSRGTGEPSEARLSASSKAEGVSRYSMSVRPSTWSSPSRVARPSCFRRPQLS